jgi:RNA polymerase sigma factor (sigma-70 family)
MEATHDARQGTVPQSLPNRLSPTAAQRACADLVQRTERPVYGFLRRLVGHRETAEDLMQETFIKAWRSWETFDPSRGGLAWVPSIARNAVGDYIRKRDAQKRIQPLPLGNHDPVDWRTGQSTLDIQRIALYWAIEQLNDWERDLITLHLARLSYSEIAVSTGRTEAAIGPALRASFADGQDTARIGRATCRYDCGACEG